MLRLLRFFKLKFRRRQLDDVVVLGPSGWAEVKLVMKGESTLPVSHQVFLMWFAAEAVEEVLQRPADIKRMSRETGLGIVAEDTARSLLVRLRAREAELLKELGKC